MNIAVFTIDPGGATGVAWGVFNPLDREGAYNAVRERQLAGSTTVEGHVRVQIREIATLWMSFYRASVQRACLPPDRVWFVSEDFIQRPGEVGGGKDNQVSSSIIWGVEGYRMGRSDEWQEHKRGGVAMPPLILQPAGMAMSTVSNQDLKDMDAWTVGREHERSAWKHTAYFLKHYQVQFPNG